jgi:hypothetical protein
MYVWLGKEIDKAVYLAPWALWARREFVEISCSMKYEWKGGRRR